MAKLSKDEKDAIDRMLTKVPQLLNAIQNAAEDAVANPVQDENVVENAGDLRDEVDGLHEVMQQVAAKTRETRVEIMTFVAHLAPDLASRFLTRD